MAADFVTTTTIEEANTPDFLDNFCEQEPIPMDIDGNNLYSQKEWFAMRLNDYINETADQGKSKKEHQTTRNNHVRDDQAVVTYK
jgi:hypothetical protein